MTDAPTPAPAEPEPFDPLKFPPDLIAAQQRLATLQAQLRALQERLPWSREPHPGWEPVDERGRQHPGRPATEGWEPADAAEFDKLWDKLREAAAEVSCHQHWARCPDPVQARMKLKQEAGAVPTPALVQAA
ncbi:hypothetical protein GTY75_09055 [Streptomyces sp. SID8381]|uniref:hypothetical protein n=1 Tax=unclassified Streptomyces TaxID=2593676 RepID=UPI00035EFF23|nr:MULTISPECIES: hypothetical protein [unclassified Streptomyces]MYX26815.1 hypothetical protein [Streptomyces sp. SID8381]